MHTGLLLLLVAAAAPGRAGEPQLLYAEYTVGTDTLPYWTGTCTRDDVNELYGKSDNTVKVEHIIWTGVPPAETTRCGWFKFKTAAIPDSATILRARIRYMVHFWQFSFDYQYTAVNVDPVSANARTLFPAIEDGTVCADVPMGRLWDTTELNAAGLAHIKNTLGQDWVAFGLWGYGWSHVLTEKAWITGWNNNPRADSPWLDINYSLTGVGEGPGPRPLTTELTVSPNPAPAGLVTLRYHLPKPGPATVRVLDAAGRTVFVTRTPGRVAAGTLSLDLRAYASGVFIVRLEAGASSSSAKLLLQD